MAGPLNVPKAGALKSDLSRPDFNLGLPLILHFVQGDVFHILVGLKQPREQQGTV